MGKSSCAQVCGAAGQRPRLDGAGSACPLLAASRTASPQQVLAYSWGMSKTGWCCWVRAAQVATCALPAPSWDPSGFSLPFKFPGTAPTQPTCSHTQTDVCTCSSDTLMFAGEFTATHGFIYVQGHIKTPMTPFSVRKEIKVIFYDCVAM